MTYQYIHHSVDDCITLFLNLFLGKSKTLRQIKFEQLKLLNLYGHVLRMCFDISDQLLKLLLRGNDVSSENVVNVTQGVQRVVVILMQCAENMG